MEEGGNGRGSFSFLYLSLFVVEIHTDAKSVLLLLFFNKKLTNHCYYFESFPNHLKVKITKIKSRN